ncbi:LysR substrate-binding domain-containing protein [Vreelandella venusta]|uniref:LysR family transcriptional regulator n=1 Tax=Vreelandella venusta TaxID=44935 RepID=A0ABX2BEG8_9GAMM|nr:LysR substrate-binding domain-containing protein [Halomonas venusta]AZM96880.1 LysR family transcriptional regulator [Halomonas venusta]NPT32289.1 LysR family transcriptional regulator [Halomonas venusta]
MSGVPFPPLNTLRAFEAAARLGSFASAAQELNLTPAAVSHRIKELEGRLDISLFVRLPRGVLLTESGRRYYGRLANVFTQIEQATKELRQQGVDGPLTLSAPHSFIHYWLIPRLGNLKALYPGLELTLRGESELLSFRDNQADIGIRFGTGDYPNLHAEHLMGDAVTILAPSSLISSLQDTRPESLLRSQLLLEDSSVHPTEPWNTWQPWLREVGVELHSLLQKLQFSDSGLTLTACVGGLGLCIGRHSIASQLLLDRKIQAIMPWRSHEFAYYLVSHPAEIDNPRVMAFKHWLIEEIKNFQIPCGNGPASELVKPSR